MNNWIDINDRLPENDYYYLVVINGESDHYFFCDDGYWCKHYGRINVSDRITHWQPLPEPPSNEEETDSELTEAFNIFWKAGLVKKGKKSAVFNKFRLRLRQSNLRPLDFAEGLASDIKCRIKLNQFGVDKLHPTTYLNGERWNDCYTQGEAKESSLDVVGEAFINEGNQ